MVPTTVPSLDGSSSVFFSTNTTTTATTSSASNTIMSPDMVTANQTTTPTNVSDNATSPSPMLPQNTSETPTTATATTAATTTTLGQVSTTQQPLDIITTPIVIQAPAPTQPPANICPDLRDRISIDISITTTTTSSDNGGSKTNIDSSSNNNNNANTFSNTNTRSRSDTDIGTARSAALHNMAPKGSHRGIILSTADHKVGTVVQVTCATDQHTVVLECNPGGFWNATIPNCRGGLDTSPYRLYLTVAGGAAGLILLVLFFLYCHLLRTRRKGSKQNSHPNSRDTDGNLYVDPYHVGERLYGSPNSPHFTRSDITYAKPIVYSTYLNPAFYEDAYERWRRQEQLVSERLYDSPWFKPRGLQKQMDTPGFKWSQTSLKTIGDSGFKKLPRAHLSMDHVSTKSTASMDSTRTRGHLSSQSSSVASMETGMLRLYPSMAAHEPRAHQLTSPHDVLPEDNESLSDFGQNTTDDGRTNF